MYIVLSQRPNSHIPFAYGAIEKEREMNNSWTWMMILSTPPKMTRFLTISYTQNNKNKK
jgi:hypothetical protein